MNTIELKHTQEIWKSVHNGSYFEINQVMPSSDKYFNLSISVYHSEPGDDTEHCRPNKEQAEAYAKLVAAAPLLRSALLKAVIDEDKKASEFFVNMEAYSTQTYEYPSWYHEAKAALAAAGVTIPDNATTTRP